MIIELKNTFMSQKWSRLQVFAIGSDKAVKAAHSNDFHNDVRNQIVNV